MPTITLNGQVYRVPGVYTAEEVISYLAGASGQFQVPILLGGSDVGYPYNFDSVKQANETNRGAFTFCGTTGALQAIYGNDSDLKIAYTMAKRHGLPNAYVSCLSKLVRAKVTTLGGAAVAQAYLYSELFGAIGGWHKVTYTAGNKLTITPVTKHSPITVLTAATDTRVYVRDNSWMVAGMTVEVGSNIVANATKVVSTTGYDLTATGQKAYWVEFTATVGAILALADYPQVAFYDPAAVEESPTFTTGQAIIDWVNSTSKYLRMVKTATFSNVLLTPTAILPIKQLVLWTPVVVGTSPAPAASDWTDFITLMDASAWDDFVIRYGVIPRLFMILTSSSTDHGVFRTWAISKRQENSPIEVICGCAWGDHTIASGADTDPGYRAQNLNSQDVALVANGADWLAPYLSRAPAVWGMIAGGGYWHNLTQDQFTFSMDEYTWNERNSGDLTYLARKGVITNRLSIDNSGARMVVMEGLNTLQNNAVAWNTGTNDTCFISQRNVSDYAQREQAFILIATQLGADEVTRDSVAVTLTRKLTDLKDKQGALTDFTIVSVNLNSTGSGWDAIVSHRYPITTDFLTVTTQIVIGEA